MALKAVFPFRVQISCEYSDNIAGERGGTAGRSSLEVKIERVKR